MVQKGSNTVWGIVRQKLLGPISQSSDEIFDHDFFSHHAQHLNFALKKDLGYSDRWKKTDTPKNSDPPPLRGVSQQPDSYYIINFISDK